MRYTLLAILTVTGFMFLVGDALAGLDVFVYPTKGQTKEQQEQDEFACYKWAKEQTGFDPTQPMQQAAAPPPQGGAAKGAAKGAAIGAIGGAIGGDAGKGGAARRRKGEQQQASAQQKAKQEYDAKVDGYRRAFSACMTGRGYTVS